MILTREQLEEHEAMVLAGYAVLSRHSKGRRHTEPADEARLPFQRDRDRIIHCRAFRRLKGKTQVFVAHYGDHYRTRLTHSLEVAQISRDVARRLGLNEDLAEAIALAHDMGHTPFGHAGEHALHECLRADGLDFEHNEQSRRLVEELESGYPDFAGLNLSIEVIEGLMKHHSSWDNPSGHETVRPSLEAQVVNFGDEIAYQNHDVDDGLRSGLFQEMDLHSVRLWRRAHEVVEARHGAIQDRAVRWGRTVSAMIKLMIDDLCQETERRLVQADIQRVEDVYACATKLVSFSESMAADNQQLKEFLMAHLYFHPKVLEHSQRGQQVLRDLYRHYRSEGRPGSGRMEPAALRDYLAGMTDSFAWEQWRQLGLG